MKCLSNVLVQYTYRSVHLPTQRWMVSWCLLGLLWSCRCGMIRTVLSRPCTRPCSLHSIISALIRHFETQLTSSTVLLRCRCVHIYGWWIWTHDHTWFFGVVRVCCDVVMMKKVMNSEKHWSFFIQQRVAIVGYKRRYRQYGDSRGFLNREEKKKMKLLFENWIS